MLEYDPVKRLTCEGALADTTAFPERAREQLQGSVFQWGQPRQFHEAYARGRVSLRERIEERDAKQQQQQQQQQKEQQRGVRGWW